MSKKFIIPIVLILVLIAGIFIFHIYSERSSIIGDWTSDKYHNKITILYESGTYYFKDHDGSKYTCSMKNGKLSINMGGINGVAYYDAKTEKLRVSIFGEQETYSRPKK